ncbi:type II secretion system major pseudopilin GspG [Candidatus Magnetominusculus xianensis]|uniref:Type II secretion system core protein G n=1 Tax=Candidatus Magnetominusculus xianensis TaxID=1748249 RepID=A0ABR5SH19_9BACT|nr:type II secretion system major pseudopilin GspG [Candidatus Magnetominusculus xianensis]KWT90985.1 type II secretion system protein GspG [Candidatus Magnetominusculus xianensis]MBF0403139.1 type II secretion system major pseudopilin GspG [Nitrospirota bacterium]
MNISGSLPNAEPKVERIDAASRKPCLGSERGFTLIEILIVVMIIGLIASLIAPNILNRFESSKEQLTTAQIELLSTSVQSFYLDVGRCPTTLNELISSTDKHWRGPYLSKQVIPQDPWHRDYQYKCPGEHGRFDIFSLGPNGKIDDKIIKNW